MEDATRKEYRPLTDEEKAKMLAVKDAGNALLGEIGSANCREFALARTKAEEAVMWAVKGITG